MSTRRAVVPIFLPEDNDQSSPTYLSPPCPVSLQFLVREEKLYMLTYMRSQSVAAILPYDLFVLTFLQESLATELGLDLGYYHHFIGSAHYYEHEEERGNALLSIDISDLDQWIMPRMPKGISPFSAAEFIIRHITTHHPSQDEGPIDAFCTSLPEYWREIARLALLSTDIGTAWSVEILDRLSSLYREILLPII